MDRTFLKTLAGVLIIGVAAGALSGYQSGADCALRDLETESNQSQLVIQNTGEVKIELISKKGVIDNYGPLYTDNEESVVLKPGQEISFEVEEGHAIKYHTKKCETIKGRHLNENEEVQQYLERHNFN